MVKVTDENIMSTKKVYITGMKMMILQWLNIVGWFYFSILQIGKQ